MLNLRVYLEKEKNKKPKKQCLHQGLLRTRRDAQSSKEHPEQ
jgi:hypothetical protein